MAQIILEGFDVRVPERPCEPGQCVAVIPPGYLVEVVDGVSSAWWVVVCRTCGRLVKRIPADEGAAR